MNLNVTAVNAQELDDIIFVVFVNDAVLRTKYNYVTKITIPCRKSYLSIFLISVMKALVVKNSN